MAKSFTIIYGLSADPIHLGHEQAIINAVEFMHTNALKIERFILIPVYQPHLIADKKPPVAHFEQRVKMCKLVAKRLSKELSCKIEVSPIEKTIAQKTGNKNFSLNTIRQLNFKNCLFMVSADHFSGRWPKFRKWHKWQHLLKQCGLLINQRPEHTINLNFVQKLKIINPNIFIVKGKNHINISSTQLRKNITPEYISEDVFALARNLYE